MSIFYVTTPIYYVNDLPHIGHIYTTVVADTVARYRRLCGDRVHFLTGTDEHGQKIEKAAKEKDLKPLELADQVVSRYHELWKRLHISHDDFVRTTEKRHRLGVEEMVRRIDAAGDFYLGRHDGWYCVSCESFYTEKELEGDKLCPVHGSPAEWKSEENVYFRLSRYQEALLEWYEKHPQFVRPATRMNEIRSFVESGLRDLSVSRASLDWGLSFPAYEGQTIYVWLDAVTNYISALGYGFTDDGSGNYRTFWEGADTRLHMVGKDILRFHAVWWPAFLLSAGLPLPTTVYAHGWWLRDERKMSKSVGNIVRPDGLIEAFGPDSLRYFLLREMVFGQDAQFSDEAFVDRFNADLANDLGNTVSRLVTLTHKALGGSRPKIRGPEVAELSTVAQSAVVGYRAAMEDFAFHDALKSLWGLLSETNQYLVANEPWKLMKQAESIPRVAEILGDGLEATRIVATALLPVMPEVAPRILEALGVKGLEATIDDLSWGGGSNEAQLPAPEPLFPRIDKAEFLVVSEEATNEMIDIEQFFQTQLRVATVTAAEPVPKSKKLLKLEVDLGAEQRTVVAGIAVEYQPEDLIGRQVVVVANLQPAKLMGVESQGMVLAASVEGRPVLLHPDSEVPNGAEVR